MSKHENGRREFIKKAAIGTAGLAAMSATSYANILGANDRINVGVVGIRSRGRAHIDGILSAKNTRIGWLCDVDNRQFEKPTATIVNAGGKKPKALADYRKLLEEKDLDAVSIATPDHLHAWQGVKGLQAGKHVYLEKPCSFNGSEGEMLIEAQQKSGKVIQMGNQQRSDGATLQGMKDIRDGLIGEPYLAKAWYTNERGPIGQAKQAPVPDWLNWELWQGPVPRREYEEPWVHYHWHWHLHWGTGEINNNGAHEIDICRWALGVDWPTKVSSAGGRYHYDDAWQWYDTQLATYEFGSDKMLTWEGNSCNPHRLFGWGRGSRITGTKGTALFTRGKYLAYDLDGTELRNVDTTQPSADTADLVGRDQMTQEHFSNFFAAIRDGAKQNSPIDEGHISVALCHLGNMAQRTGSTLEVDPANGHVKNNPEAQALWTREYEPGWEMGL